MKKEEWHADIQVTEELVRSCLQEQFPALAPIEEIKLVGEGWDNRVFLINEKFIFRFPRRKVAVELIERENKVLNNLPTFLNIDIPRPKYLGHPTSQYPYPFQGYQLIKGISGYQAQLSTQDRIVSLSALANFLKQLHSIDEAQAKAMGGESQVFDRTIVEKLVDTLKTRVAKIITLKLCNINKDEFQQEIATVKEIVLPFDQRCLVHGDLDCRHLLFDKNQITGIIDWGDLGINNKSVDLAVVWSFYPPQCHQAFFKIYGTVDSATWQYARFIGLYISFILILYAKDIGDNLLFTEAIDAVKRINPNLLID